jgi:alkylation response protein AidB-like acyl-CoA dehydrogenase
VSNGPEIPVLDGFSDIMEFFREERVEVLLTSVGVAMGKVEPARAMTRSTHSGFTQKAGSVYTPMMIAVCQVTCHPG